MKHGTPTENIDRHIAAVFAMEAVVDIVHSESEIVAHVCRQMRIDGYPMPEESAIRERLSIARATRTPKP